MPEPATRRLRFDSEALEVPQPWTVTNRGLEYSGEAIVSHSVTPSLGGPLERGLSFRVVFFTVPRRIPVSHIRDARIAMAVPRRTLDERRGAITTELRAIHETRARYSTSTDPGDLAVRGLIDNREASLNREMARRDSIGYSQGRVYTRSPAMAPPADISVDDDPGSWADALAAAVLEGAHPDLPFHHADFPSTLTEQKMAALYAGLFRRDAGQDAALGTFAVALGLARPEEPMVFDPRESRVFGIIRKASESHAEEIPAGDVLGLLCAKHGLNRALAALYVLAYVRQEHGEVELVPYHGVRSVTGERIQSDRIAWDLAPEISFSGSIGDYFETIRLRHTVSWNSIVPYAALLVEGIGPEESPIEIAAQERRLVGALGEFGGRLEEVVAATATLAAGLGEGPRRELDAVDRLRVLASTSGFAEFHSAAVDNFDGPSGLREALDFYRRLERVSDLAPAMAEARRYLRDMTFGPEHQNLVVERDAVAASIDLDSLVANPDLWGSIHAGYMALRRRYLSAYRTHHKAFHRKAEEMAARLKALRPQVRALEMFNQIRELEGPLGETSPPQFRKLLTSVELCATAEVMLTLEIVPYCSECRIKLDQEPPTAEAARVCRDIEEAVREYNGRLGSHAVRRVLSNATTDHLSTFKDLVQVGDTSALENVLDDEVVEFLRSFLRA